MKSENNTLLLTGVVSRFSRFHQGSHSIIITNQCHVFKAGCFELLLDLGKGVRVASGKVYEHIDGEYCPLWWLGAKGIHDIIADENCAARDEGAIYLAIQGDILFGAVLVNDGGKQGQIAWSGKIILIEVSCHEGYALNQPFFVDVFLGERDHAFEVEK